MRRSLKIIATVIVLVIWALLTSLMIFLGVNDHKDISTVFICLLANLGLIFTTYTTLIEI